MDWTNNLFQKKWVRAVLIIWVVVVLLIVGYAIYVNVIKINKISVMVKCAPYSSFVYIDDVEVNNNSETYLEEGEHKVLCFLPGFGIEEQNITISKTKSNALIELLPITTNGEDIYKASRDDYYDLEAFAGKESGTDIADYGEKDKELLKFLPYNTDNFGLGTFINNDESVVTVTVWKKGYTQMAVNKLINLAKEAGVSLSLYDFRINDFVNQLQDFKDNNNKDLEEFIKNGYSGLDIQFRGSGEVNGYTYVLISVVQPSGERVIYRAILNKKDNKWHMVNTPYPILTLFNTSDLKQELLDEINNKEVILKNNT